jgi:hypothetical protein
MVERFNGVVISKGQSNKNILRTMMVMNELDGDERRRISEER